ncbi:hypothetical protein B8A20_11620 [Staphylococcus aureus]|nr:hypothetical protein B8A21_11995 [Staphylococcus aureus]ORN50409.1 hypothetical protein B8A20_11620 [Staphylococcus aureus]
MPVEFLFEILCVGAPQSI